MPLKSSPSPASDTPVPSIKPPHTVWELINDYAYPSKLKVYMVLDARRLKDNVNVCIKRISKVTKEVTIAQYLASNQDSRNHCTPVWDDFRDPDLPDVSYMVMPVLRDFNDPEFGARGEVVDFVTQMLEGMTFMHSQGVAHSDLTAVNIMMDARPILPRGWHFSAPRSAPNGYGNLKPFARIDHPVRYYIINFDNAVRFLPGQSSIVKGLGGRDSDPPELATTHIPFDHFKLDVFTLGNVFLKELKNKYLSLDFLDGLLTMMMTRDYRKRTTAQAALDYWVKVRDSIPVASARWPLRKPEESVGEAVVNTFTAAREGVHNLRYLFEHDKRKWDTL
ncbi:hypothetical protein DXG03_003040 [Asterophora parasitica]|uniref:Protein kinase domain-containing protein n=1 Tax=Asterophora parasitica TaxID=117018 RepID=A0A9P7K8E6_9AGAR|nr:hypothetical protein DXG03_003040 [Asterophora parasitica]